MEIPTDVIDIYEHAFYVDYQNRKTDYVEKFIVIRSFAGAFRKARPGAYHSEKTYDFSVLSI